MNKIIMKLAAICAVGLMAVTSMAAEKLNLAPGAGMKFYQYTAENQPNPDAEALIRKVDNSNEFTWNVVRNTPYSRDGGFLVWYGYLKINKPTVYSFTLSGIGYGTRGYRNAENNVTVRIKGSDGDAGLSISDNKAELKKNDTIRLFLDAGYYEIEISSKWMQDERPFTLRYSEDSSVDHTVNITPKGLFHRKD